MICSISSSTPAISVLIRARPPIKLAARSCAGAHLAFDSAELGIIAAAVAHHGLRSLTTFGGSRFERLQLLGDGIAVATSRAKLGLGIVPRAHLRK
jgi:hypothetical protein